MAGNGNGWDGRADPPIPLYGGMIYPGQGYPQNPGMDRPGLSPFGRLAKDQPLGQTTQLFYSSADSNDLQVAEPGEILRIEGDDLDACQMCITLAPPRVQPIAFADLAISAATDPQGSWSNAEAATGDDFPGTAAQVAWPPLEAIIEWGTRGMQARAVVDYVNGVVVNVTGSFVKVLAAVSQGSDVGVAGSSALYQIGGFIGPGWAKQTNARRTIFLGTVANGAESDVFAVPKFGGRALVIGLDSGVTPNVFAGMLRFWQSPSGQAGGKIVGMSYQSSNNPQPADVPNAGMYFSVNNQSGADMKIAVVFELALS